MNKNQLVGFIKPTIFTICIFLIISYFIVPVFSIPSPCYNFANTPAAVQSVPCIKLMTIPEYLHPTYITRYGFHYQSNADYYYDVSTQYVHPILNLFFAFGVSRGIIYGIYRIVKKGKL